MSPHSPGPVYEYMRGDLVYAARDLHNDEATADGASPMPEAAPGALLAAAGTRGMVVNVGHAEAAPEQIIYLVSFETGKAADGSPELGLPFGCLPEELTQQEQSTHGHVILRWLAEQPLATEALRARVASELGSRMRFHTCDTGNLTIDALLDLLATRGKIVREGDCWRTETAKVCADEMPA